MFNEGSLKLGIYLPGELMGWHSSGVATKHYLGIVVVGGDHFDAHIVSIDL